MSRRLNPCRTCNPDTSGSKFPVHRGFTRHDDRVCSRCRQYGPPPPPMPKGWPWGRAA